MRLRRAAFARWAWRGPMKRQWKFLGVLPLFDPPREQAKATIASAHQMGVHVKMVTGDQLAIAKEMRSQLGMGTNILDASGLGDTRRTASRPTGGGH